MGIHYIVLIFKAMLNVKITTHNAVRCTARRNVFVDLANILAWDFMKVTTGGVKFLRSTNIFSHLFLLFARCNFKFFVSAGGAVLTAGWNFGRVRNHIRTFCTTLN